MYKYVTVFDREIWRVLVKMIDIRGGRKRGKLAIEKRKKERKR